MREIVNDRVKEIDTTAHDAAKDIVIAHLQKKLEQANQKFEILSKATYDAIWDWDLQTNLIEWNHGLKTLFGYDEKKNAHNYCTWADNIHPQDKAEVLKNAKRVYSPGS